MKKLSFAFAAVIAVGFAAPAVAADYMPAYAPPPPPETCLQRAWSEYGGSHPNLARPFVVTKAIACRLLGGPR